MSDVPGDVTLGEVWRGQQDIVKHLERLAEVVRKLPGEMEAVIDKRTDEKLKLRDDRIGLLQRLVFGAVGLVLLSVAASVVALVIRPT